MYILHLMVVFSTLLFIQFSSLSTFHTRSDLEDGSAQSRLVAASPVA